MIVSVQGGTLREVTVRSGNSTVDGKLSDRTWRSTDKLGYGRTYTVTASVADAAGAVSE